MFSYCGSTILNTGHASVGSLLNDIAAPFWDSGPVPQNWTVSGLGVVYSGPPHLSSGSAYWWNLRWQSDNGTWSEESALMRFVTNNFDDNAWKGAQWVGAGHSQFRTQFEIPEQSNISSSSSALSLQHKLPMLEAAPQWDAFIFISSPGGYVVKVNGILLPGGDQVGVQAWFDWTSELQSSVLDIAPLLLPGKVNEVEVTIGCGCWCPSAVPTWEHSGRFIHTLNGQRPLTKILITVSKPSGTVTTKAPDMITIDNAGTFKSKDMKNLVQLATGVTRANGSASFESRVGPVNASSSSSWLGSTQDWTLAPNYGWQSPARLVPNDTLLFDLPQANNEVNGKDKFQSTKENVSQLRMPHPKAPTPLPQPPLATFASIYAKSVKNFTAVAHDFTKNPSSSVFGYLYEFPTMIVGTANIAAGAWSGNGRIYLEFCEYLDYKGQCVKPKAYTQSIVDTHIVDDAIQASNYPAIDRFAIHASVPNTTAELTGAFSWRGFQYVIVTMSDNVYFRGGINDITGVWAGLKLQVASNISFTDSGKNGGAAQKLMKLVDLTQRGFRSNLLTGLPTDCPTRLVYTIATIEILITVS